MEAEKWMEQFNFDNQFRLEAKVIKNYQCAVKQFLAYSGKDLHEIVKRDIRNWLSHLVETGYKISTISKKLVGLKSFFKYCIEEEFLSVNPVADYPYPRLEEKIPFYLTLEQLAQLRRVLAGRSLEERAIVEVLYATGIRISECCSIKKEDIDWSDRLIRIPKGKGKKERIVLFTRECAEHLTAYLDSRTDDLPYVFLNVMKKNRPIHPDTIGQWFRQWYTKHLGFKITPHTLRYTFTAHLARKGMPYQCLQKLLGHENPNQTRLYAKLYDVARKEKFDEYM